MYKELHSKKAFHHSNAFAFVTGNLLPAQPLEWGNTMYYKSSILILNCQYISWQTVQIISFYYKIRRYQHEEPPIWTPLSSGRLQNKIEFIKKIKWTIRFIKIHVLFGIYQTMQKEVLNILIEQFTCSMSSLFTQSVPLYNTPKFSWTPWSCGPWAGCAVHDHLYPSIIQAHDNLFDQKYVQSCQIPENRVPQAKVEKTA